MPAIPLPEPRFMITVTHGSNRSRRARVNALRFLLWVVPAGVADYVLATADGGRHSLWMTLAAAYATLALAVLTVNAEAAGEDSEAPGARASLARRAALRAAAWLIAPSSHRLLPPPLARVLAVKATAIYLTLRLREEAKVAVPDDHYQCHGCGCECGDMPDGHCWCACACCVGARIAAANREDAP
jgi:hypothetical protein